MTMIKTAKKLNCHKCDINELRAKYQKKANQVEINIGSVILSKNENLLGLKIFVVNCVMCVVNCWPIEFVIDNTLEEQSLRLHSDLLSLLLSIYTSHYCLRH